VKATRGPVVVFGIAFLYPLAGVTWQFLHYLVGLRRLGFDPYYVEDSGRWVYDPALGDFTPDPARNIEIQAAWALREEFDLGAAELAALQGTAGHRTPG